MMKGGAWAVAGFISVIAYFIGEDAAIQIIGTSLALGGGLGLLAAFLASKVGGAGRKMNFDLIPIFIIIAYIVTLLGQDYLFGR